MKIRVLFFAQLREMFGVAEKIVEVEQTMRAGPFAQKLFEEAGLGPERVSHLRYSINEEFVDETVELKKGDVFSILAPFAGG